MYDIGSNPIELQFKWSIKEMSYDYALYELKACRNIAAFHALSEDERDGIVYKELTNFFRRDILSLHGSTKPHYLQGTIEGNSVYTEWYCKGILSACSYRFISAHEAADALRNSEFRNMNGSEDLYELAERHPAAVLISFGYW